MIRQILVSVLLLVLVAANTLAQANNPVSNPPQRPQARNFSASQENPAGPEVKATPGPTPAQAGSRTDPTQDPGVRKLSRRERKERIASLDQKYRDFLRDVEPIMVPTELNTFLLMESDSQRDAFIENFWSRRDTDIHSSHNNYRDTYEEMLVEAKEMFKNMSSDRARIYLSRGRPDNRIVTECSRLLQPMEIWEYGLLPGMGHRVSILFYVPRLGSSDDYKLWTPIGRGDEDLADLVSQDQMTAAMGDARTAVQNVFYQSAGASLGSFVSRIKFECKDGDAILTAIYTVQQNRLEVGRLFEPPQVKDEDINKFLRSSVLANPSAPKLTSEFAALYPGKRGSRTTVDLTVLIPTSELQVKEIEGARFYNIDVTGEILKDNKLFENFQYRFNFPAETAGEKLPVAVERYLRPATYRSRIKVTDANSGAEALVENDITVPEILEDATKKALREEGGSAIQQLQDEVERGVDRIRIVPLSSDLLTGLQHIDTIVSGDGIKSVEFYLDNHKVMVKRSPPYSLDLDFGNVPQKRAIKVLGLSEKGDVISGDEADVNTGTNPFRVRIVSPRIAPNVSGNLRVELDASVPEGKKLKQLDLFLNETKLATLFDPPFVQIIRVPKDLGIAYLRAVATLVDPAIAPTEDVVFLNSPQFAEEINVHLVELPTTVTRGNRLVNNLEENAFKVFDEGKPVKITKFEHVDNLPLSLGVAIDTSASMMPRMTEAQKAGAAFLKDTLKPGDRAFVVGFDIEPAMVQKWTNHLSDLNAGLASLRAESSTALYDAIVYSLYNFLGVRGQRALIVISDGKDTSSKFSFDQAVEYAKRSGIPIYGIGIGIRSSDIEARFKFSRFSSETGGATYYIDSVTDLSRIYNQIQTELRSQYILGFYPDPSVKAGTDWREVKVEVSDGRAKTIRGYYP
ncbi:MAG: VWA domain-containing protein [Acidobacteriota bacterium]